jgi:hypothetical protein
MDDNEEGVNKFSIKSSECFDLFIFLVPKTSMVSLTETCLG